MKKSIKIIVLLLVLLSSVVFIKIASKNKTPELKKKNFKAIDINYGEQIYSFDEYIYIYGKAGIKVNKEEKEIFSDTFSLDNPVVSTSHKKIAISDERGKTVRVYSEQGNLYTVNTNNVLGFSVNKNGFLAVITKEKESYFIDVYNNNGETVFSIKNISYKDGIPINVSISQDNKTLAVSYVKTSGATVDSNILFYSLKDNRVFGGFVKQNQLVGISNFVDNSNFVGISDKEVFIIKVNSSYNNEQAKEVYIKNLSNIIKYFNFLDGVGYVICYGQQISNSEKAVKENTLVFYNNSGGEIGKFAKNDLKITKITSSKYGCIIEEGRLFTAISTSGRKLWEYQATQDIQDVLFYTDENKILIATNNQLKIVNVDKKLFDKQISNNFKEEETKDSKQEPTKDDEDSKQEPTKNNKKEPVQD